VTNDQLRLLPEKPLVAVVVILQFHQVGLMLVTSAYPRPGARAIAKALLNVWAEVAGNIYNLLWPDM
jgi:hypothetical protein